MFSTFAWIMNSLFYKDLLISLIWLTDFWFQLYIFGFHLPVESVFVFWKMSLLVVVLRMHQPVWGCVWCQCVRVFAHTQPGVYSRLVEVHELHNLHLPPAQWQGRRGQLPTPISSSSACWGISSLLFLSILVPLLSSHSTGSVCYTVQSKYRWQGTQSSTCCSPNIKLSPLCPCLTKCLCICLNF